jgi:tripartite-type tricarboxylate transporter receptor subunit TctC
MKLPRRTFLRLTMGAAALPALPHVARAQNYPSRPVRIIVGSAPGGPPDISKGLAHGKIRVLGARRAPRETP